MLFDHAAKLEQSQSIDDLWQDFMAILPSVGIDHAIYVSVANDMSDPFVLTSIPELYSERPPHEDPFLIHCCTSYKIIEIGTVFMHRHPYIDDAERAFITRAATLGFRAGLGIPMRLMGAARFGCFLLGNGQALVEFEKNVSRRAEELRLFCMIVHRRIEELNSPAAMPSASDTRPGLVGRELPPVFDALTARETEVILLLCQGKTRAESAQICGISVNTLSGYVKAGYKKLGVTNAVQATTLLR
ncbi:LuxR family transcriptional regulator [Sulfitobacter sp. S190]|uniref:helix-turn-helix transcriptional regulator n=1 Tax=Sulfitobacter sp. S190 TaxID=2867022 RepID=UPI0021A79CB6|nr:LuxR family transcriptional regulator [Sulfitobacter sp. S190]UWR22896.1 LuxR family transcriptional regulator [Sulfitobacter sp. S190]